MWQPAASVKPVLLGRAGDAPRTRAKAAQSTRQRE